MNRSNSEANIEKPIMHHHVHYHYYPSSPRNHIYSSQVESQSNDQATFKKHFSRTRTEGTENRSTTSEAEEWRKQINPETTRIYDEGKIKDSRLSETIPKISEQEPESDGQSPMKSAVVTSTPYSSIQLGQQKHTSKLDELYFQTREQRNRPQSPRIQRTQKSKMSESQMMSKLKEYKKQIQTLKRVEEECIYLREQFYNHAERMHPDELNN